MSSGAPRPARTSPSSPRGPPGTPARGGGAAPSAGRPGGNCSAVRAGALRAEEGRDVARARALSLRLPRDPGPGRPRGRQEAVEGRRRADSQPAPDRSEEHTSELQSLTNLVCRLLLEKKKNRNATDQTKNKA